MKTCLITGASRGIGAATAKLFAQNGYTVLLNYNRSKAEAEKICDEIRRERGDAHIFGADVSDEASVRALFAWTAKYLKHLDVLVNNAGVSLTKQLQNTTSQEFDNVMSVNAKGVFLCCREAFPLLAKSGGGTIVNVSSVWGLQGASCESVYSMSKHAVIGLTKSLAEELLPANIKVNCVCPPIVSTDMCAHLSQKDIADFCEERRLRLYNAAQVAEDIFRLATCGRTGVILSEK